MGKKIKSALELAMEQTANLKDLHRESPEQEYEPYFKAASLLAESFLKMQTAPEKAFDAISRYPAGARDKAARIFLEKAVAEMQLTNCTGVTKAYRLFHAGRESDLLGAIEELDGKYREEVREVRSRAEEGHYETMLLDPLRRAGIGGSALAGVNLERSSWWGQKLGGLAEGYQSQLASLKERLLLSITE